MKQSVQKDKKALEHYRKLVRQIQEQTEINLFETPEEQKVRIKRLLGNYEEFVEYYFPHYASSKCASFHIKLANMVKRDPFIALLLAWARGLAKSTHCDILIPLWLWCNGMLRVMLLIGQTEEKAKKLLGDLQAELEGNQRLKNDFGNQLGGGNWQDGNFITANDCAFFAIGVGQSPRGIRYKQFRPDYIICDDLDTKQVCKNPKRVREYANWICEDLIPCADERGCRFIDVNNVFAKLTILTELRDTREGFKYWQQDATDSEFNPYWKEKYTKEFYLKLAKKIGMLSFQSEYNNKPYVEGTIFKNEMIQWAEIPHLNHFDHILSWWDVAYSDSKTADFNAIKVWGLKGDRFYLIKAFVRQCKMYDAIKWMFDYNDTLPSTVHINFYFESQFWNDALKMVYDQVVKERGHSIPLIKADRPRTNKFDRIVSQLPFYEQSRIYYNIKEKGNNDMQVGIAQLLAIEEGSKEHDDSPDADQAAIDKLSKHIQLTQFEPRFGGRTHMVMEFVEEKDYGTLIDKQALAVFQQTDEENRIRAEGMAREELTDYLSGRYNLERAFSATGEARNMRLVMMYMDISLYHMASWLPGNMGLSIREKRYESAVKWMEEVRDGKLNPNLPLKGDEGQENYDPAEASIMKWGSYTKNNNDW